MTHGGFKLGDYVIVRERTEFDDPWFDDFPGTTFKVRALIHNAFGRETIRVVDIARPDSPGTLFYPGELRYEDGTHPTL